MNTPNSMYSYHTSEENRRYFKDIQTYIATNKKCMYTGKILTKNMMV